jgi:stalled ribosome rescue protein Dom34
MNKKCVCEKRKKSDNIKTKHEREEKLWILISFLRKGTDRASYRYSEKYLKNSNLTNENL